MIKVVTLCSGSKGNSTFIEINGLKILIDSGKVYRYLVESLNKINIDIKDIDYVFVTHNHGDHVNCLHTIIRSNKAKLCITNEVYNSLKIMPAEKDVIFFEDEIIIKDIKFRALKSSHDAPDSRNFTIEYDNKKISLITDTGYVKQKHFKNFYNSDIFLMESNHDIDMLQNCSYRVSVKQRILSDIGHLSNNQAGFYLSKIIGPNTKKVLLIHLSEESNTPKIALSTVKNILNDYNIEFENIDYARQFELSEVMTID